MKRIFKTLQWFIGAIIIVVGLSTIKETTASSIFMILAGLLVIPLLRGKLLSPKYFKKVGRIGLILALLTTAFILERPATSQKTIALKAIKYYVEANQDNLAIRNTNFIKKGERLFSMPFKEYETDWEPFDIDTTAIERINNQTNIILIVRPKCSYKNSKLLFVYNYVNEPEHLENILGYKLQFTLGKDYTVESVKPIYEIIRNGGSTEIMDTTTDLSINAKSIEIQNMENKLTEYRNHIKGIEQKKKQDAERKNHFEKDCLSDWDGSCTPLVSKVKTILNDPKSFDHIETKYLLQEDSYYVEMKFRAKNGFGLMVANKAIALINEECEVLDFEVKK